MAIGLGEDRPLDIVLSDATGGRPEGAELRCLLESVGGFSVTAEVVRPGDRKFSGLPSSVLVVLVTHRFSEADQRWLFSKLDPETCGPLLVAVLDPDTETLNRWIEWGATDYFTFPWNAADVLPRIHKAAGHTRGRLANPSQCRDKLALDQMIGQSASLRAAIERIPAIAACDAGVLITGETGTGKELCARAIHYLGQRTRRPFVPLNCGAIPADLVENELFGHAPGAFTGANNRQQGLVAEAECGTLFLDEVDSLPLASQVKMLRFLQSKEYRPLGGSKTLMANVRVIAATNTDPAEAVKSGRLRQDIYYRLNVIPLQLPPLRDRKEDIPLLAAHFLARYAREFGKDVPAMPDEVVARLMAHNWPGNVRELENVIARMVALATSPELQCKSLELAGDNGVVDPQSLHAAKGQFERAYIEEKLTSCGGNISQAARAAGKNRRYFWELIRKHRIEVDKFKIPAAQLR